MFKINLTNKLNKSEKVIHFNFENYKIAFEENLKDIIYCPVEIYCEKTNSKQFIKIAIGNIFDKQANRDIAFFLLEHNNNYYIVEVDKIYNYFTKIK